MDKSDDRASDFFDVHLEPRHVGALRRVGYSVASAVATAVAGDVVEFGSVADLVILRRATGLEVHRTPAGSMEEADRLLEAARRDLREKSVAEFAEEWNLSS